MVSGRAGIGLIDLLYQNELVPASTISNVVVFCNSEKKLKEAKEYFANRSYPKIISIAYEVYDQEHKYLKTIKTKI